MASTPIDDVFLGLGLRVFEDGRFERLTAEDFVPPSIHPETGVQSKDVKIDPETGLSARLYTPQITADTDRKKLPLLVYFHGGGFCISSAFSPTYHSYINSLVAQAKIVVVSVEYRRAPEHPLPIAYEDSWAAVKWVASHSDGGHGQEDWLRDHADFNRMFFAGDSAGANIAHNMGLRAGSDGLTGTDLVGIVLFHPYFLKNLPGDGPGGEFLHRLWKFAFPTSSGSDDPWINPGNDPKLSSMGCRRLLICVADQDFVYEMGKYYYEVLSKCGWGGEVELMEQEGEGHGYYLHKPTGEKAVALLKKAASFLNE